MRIQRRGFLATLAGLCFWRVPVKAPEAVIPAGEGVYLTQLPDGRRTISNGETAFFIESCCYAESGTLRIVTGDVA